jgi:hypothetical protein
MLQMGKTSLVHALMSRSSTCASIAADDRTVGIDRYEMKLRLDPFATVSSAIDAQIWDLAGQDVYTLSHSVHFSHRCLYMLLWKPGETVDATMRRVSPWLESLCTHVPDAHVVLVASHCRTNITVDEFQALSCLVEAAAYAKMRALNDLTRLEVDRIRIMFRDAETVRQRLETDYAAHASSHHDMARQDAAFLERMGHGAGFSEVWAARAAASCGDLPLSLRTRAAAVYEASKQERLLCERLQLLLGIRDGGCPDGRDACKLTLHCHSVDSVEGCGVADLRRWLYDHCRSLPFVGEMISSNWMAVASVFRHFGDSVLSRADALALVRQHMPRLPRLLSLSDDALWSIIEFWSDVGRVFVYDSQVVREPSTLIALLKPLLHHEPLQMMTLPVYQSLLADSSLKSTSARAELQVLLQRLRQTDELSLQLLGHLSAWKDLTADQRSSMLAFFERSRLLCRVEQRPDVRLLSARIRANDYLSHEVERVTAMAIYHVLYLLPLNHIGVIAHLQSAVSALSLEAVTLKCKSGRDSLFLHRLSSPDCACVFSVEDYSSSVQHNERFKSLHGLLGEQFSCVLRISCTDFGIFKFAAACADAAMDSCNFGSRFECWLTVVDAAPVGSGHQWAAQEWVMFRDASSSSLSKRALADALQQNIHSEIVPGRSIFEYLRPRSCIFVSHAWGDGTLEFIKRLKSHVEHQTLASVWVDQSGLNQEQEWIIPSFRDALCQARIVFVVLTPSYLTRPNCLRELRWALDFERAGHLKVVLLSLHNAVTFDERLKLVEYGPHHGLVFSSKEKKFKRLCPEAVALVKRLNDVHMNTLPWHELQAWRSDTDKGDWEEHRQYIAKGVDKQVHLAGCQEGLIERTVKAIRDMLVCAAPRPAADCFAMDDTDALLATDVQPGHVPSELLRVELYPETAAREVLLLRQVQRGDAAWEQDSSRVACPVPGCGKGFNMINRRHHCRCVLLSCLLCVQLADCLMFLRLRFCGRVMCGGCAPVLELVGSHDNVRCCAVCFAAFRSMQLS